MTSQGVFMPIMVAQPLAESPVVWFSFSGNPLDAAAADANMNPSFWNINNDIVCWVILGTEAAIPSTISTQ